MKVAVAANTLAESATTTAVPYVDVHETHTGVVVLARRTGIYGEEAGVAGTEFFRSRPVVACRRRRSGSDFAAAARRCGMVAPPLNHLYRGETSEHRQVAAAASWGVPRQGQGLRRRGSEVAA
jgi:hypothetical protein